MAEQTNTTGMPQTEPTINITPAAIAEIKRLHEQENRPELFLRVGIVSGGCSGMSYAMAFDDTPQENDLTYDYDGVTVRLNSEILEYLKGTTLDYKGGMLGGGFSFENPNARRSCGCGTSFTC
jgi:iron-sulfur cluster assembly protein